MDVGNDRRYWMASYITTNSEVENIRGLLNPTPYAGLRRRSGGLNEAVLGFRGNPVRPCVTDHSVSIGRLLLAIVAGARSVFSLMGC